MNSVRVATCLVCLLVGTGCSRSPSPAAGDAGAARDPATTRVPGEWEPHAATWIQWPTNWEASLRPEVAKVIDAIQDHEPLRLLALSQAARSKAQAYLKAKGVPGTNITWHIVPYDNSWLRDNGPIYVRDRAGLWVQDWGFNAWGGNFGKNVGYKKDDAVPVKIAATLGLPYEAHGDYVLERGNVEFNGGDAMALNWDCQKDRNPGWTRAQAEALFKKSFGVTRVLWVYGHNPSDGTTGHIDGILRFVSRTRVAVARSRIPKDPDAPIYENAAKAAKAAGFQVTRVDIPGTVRHRGVDLPAVYMNWLIGNGFVVVQGFGKAAWDQAAKATIQALFPGRKVYMITALELWYQGGGLHCITNDQPRIK